MEVPPAPPCPALPLPPMIQGFQYIAPAADPKLSPTLPVQIASLGPKIEVISEKLFRDLLTVYFSTQTSCCFKLY